MERLTNRIFVPKEERELVVFTQGEYIDTIPAEMTHEDIRKVLRKLAEYEEAEEQGLLLRLPCKIGSILYQPISNRQINEYKAIDLCFNITRNEFMYEVIYQIGLEWYKTTCDFDCINKTVFLTQAEAEQKLKEAEQKLKEMESE